MPLWAAVALSSLAALLLGFLVFPNSYVPSARNALVREAVNDHLRVLFAKQPIEIAGGALDELLPALRGRIDFAPDVSFGGSADFPLQGGAVGYVIDRKAAAFMFKRQQHPISLFVFPAHDLPWPVGPHQALGRGVPAHVREQGGFCVVLWRDHALGHALVSDVERAELLRLAGLLTQAR